ncbi:MAG TPA: hypothetical protein VGE28_02575 [Pseudomonas sp.]
MLMVLIAPVVARLVAAALVAAPPMAPMAIGPTIADMMIAMISCAAPPNPDWLCLQLSCSSLTWRQGEIITVPNEQFE